MPIWFELVFLLLATYAAGIIVGWVLWGREITAKIGTKTNDTDTEEEEAF